MVKIEIWVKNNQYKIGFLCVLFIMWCFYSIVKGGGAIIPRVETLETKALQSEDYKARNDQLNDKLKNDFDSMAGFCQIQSESLMTHNHQIEPHIHLYHNGEAVGKN